jgi:hypothetical protein
MVDRAGDEHGQQQYSGGTVITLWPCLEVYVFSFNKLYVYSLHDGLMGLGFSIPNIRVGNDSDNSIHEG